MNEETEPEWEPGLRRVKLPKYCIISIDETIDTLINTRAWYPEWIHISPFAFTQTHLA